MLGSSPIQAHPDRLATDSRVNPHPLAVPRRDHPPVLDFALS
jgi:hypothetical protein